MSIVILGGINEDVVISVAALPLPGETIASRGVGQSAGGKGLNQAVAAARFGGATRLLGAVGQDPAGAYLLNVLDDAGVDRSGVQILADLATGRAFICLAADGTNSIIVDAAANAHYGAAAVRERQPTAQVCLTQFEARVDAVEALFATPDCGLRILNAAPALTEHRDLLAQADILIVNETECMAFAGVAALPDDLVQLAAMARSLMVGDLAQVVVTLGAEGCLLVDRDTHQRFASYAVPVIDTVGAGDCFAGVLAAALAEGMELPQSIRYAVAAAALSVGRHGAAASSPQRAEVEIFLQSAAEHAPQS